MLAAFQTYITSSSSQCQALESEKGLGLDQQPVQEQASMCVLCGTRERSMSMLCYICDEQIESRQSDNSALYNMYVDDHDDDYAGRSLGSRINSQCATIDMLH
jgi:hypothetical protein